MTSKRKKVFMSFCPLWAPFFSNQSKLGAIFARIFKVFAQIFGDFGRVSQILQTLPEFSPNQNFWGCACTSASCNHCHMHRWWNRGGGAWA